MGNKAFVLCHIIHIIETVLQRFLLTIHLDKEQGSGEFSGEKKESWKTHFPRNRMTRVNTIEVRFYKIPTRVFTISDIFARSKESIVPRILCFFSFYKTCHLKPFARDGKVPGPRQ